MDHEVNRLLAADGYDPEKVPVYVKGFIIDALNGNRKSRLGRGKRTHRRPRSQQHQRWCRR